MGPALQTETMEPALQTKKRVQPPFLKTAPVKGIYDGLPLQSNKRASTPSPTHISTEPMLQAKKRVMQDVPKTALLQPRVSEPPLQSKKRTPGPPTTLINGFSDDGVSKADQYTLLGNQDKFSENVKYRIKENPYTRDMSPAKQIKLQKTVKHNENCEPSPAPAINTDQFTKPITPPAPRGQNNHPGHKLQDIKESNMVNEPRVSRSPRQSHKEVVRDSKAKQDQTKNLDRDEPVKMSMKDKRIENMNEHAHTNIEKGVADSSPEAPTEYALKYKTSITMPRPSVKMSEYQKQYQWKAGLSASPLLKAEQVVYNNNPQLSAPKYSMIPKVTEYQKQYKAYKLVPVFKKEPVYEASKRNVQLKKSKSMEELSPGEIPTAGSSPVISPSNKRLTLETDQKVPEPVPVVPKKRSRHMHSEYESNFKPPGHYDYLRGSWHGASPPDLHLEVAVDSPSCPPLTNWFAEVLELRCKAQEYRQRALGTHFSREHMAQLMAKQTDLWDTAASSARSTLSALSLESGLSSHKVKKHQQKVMNGEQFKEESSTGATVASDDEGSNQMSEVRDNLQPREAWSDEKDEEESPATPSTHTPEPSVVQYHQPSSKSHGRVQMSATQHRRHHLDRTTPLKDGAILSSQEPKKHTGKKMVARSVDSGVLNEGSAREHRPIVGQKMSSSANGFLSTLRTCGMPSRDTHALRDDAALIDRELRTQFVYTPARVSPGGLLAIDEGFGQTYNKPQPAVKHNPAMFCWTIDGGVPAATTNDDDDDDVLSVSMQSIASSCSLASATLERAWKRKQEFWGKGTVKAK